MAVGLIDNNAFVQQIIDKGKAEANKRNTGELGKQEFLNLLVMQLRYQDPLNPVEDKEFIAQMAQFSALEQMQSMNASNTAMKGFSMIGKYVTAMLADEATGKNSKIEGHVESVVMNGSRTYVVVGGKEVPIDSVYNVADGFNPLSSALSAYTGLIGYDVRGAVFDLTTGEVVGISGEVVSLEKGAYEDFAMLNGVSAVIAGINKDGVIIEDRAKIREYLENAANAEKADGRRIEVFISSENGKRVPIGATLRSYAYDAEYGTIKAVLDEVAVPVASVASIRKAAANAVQQPSAADGDAQAENKAAGGEIPAIGETAGNEADGVADGVADAAEYPAGSEGLPEAGTDAADAAAAEKPEVEL